MKQPTMFCRYASIFSVFVCLMASGVNAGESPFSAVSCGGLYPHHLQGVCTDEEAAIFWSFTTMLVKTDASGKVLKKIEVENHHGDLCFQEGKIYVAVNLGKFNRPAGEADSWVYVYQAEDLAFLAKHVVPEVVHGAGGMAFRDGKFVVVGGLPEGVEENYAYLYDEDFGFLERQVIDSGYTKMGVQTLAFAEEKFWFGCYGGRTLKTDSEFFVQGNYAFDCALGVIGIGDGKILVARKTGGGKEQGGRLVVATIGEDGGLVVGEE
jgi:hypothetical protein